jgi:hypothetical protein
MNIIVSTGLALGIAVGLIIAAILIKVANTNHKVKTEYDERQLLIRGKGYMYAFYTILAYQVVMMILSAGDIELPIERYAQDCVGIILGCIVLGVYCIWNDVYWGLNNNKKSYTIIFILAMLFNIIPIVGMAKGGTLVENGKIGMPILNIMVLFMMAVLGIELIIKKVVNDKKDEQED